MDESRPSDPSSELHEPFAPVTKGMWLEFVKVGVKAGALVGAICGSIFPVIGTVIGLVIGILVGAALGVVFGGPASRVAKKPTVKQGLQAVIATNVVWVAVVGLVIWAVFTGHEPGYLVWLGPSVLSGVAWGTQRAFSKVQPEGVRQDIERGEFGLVVRLRYVVIITMLMTGIVLATARFWGL